MTKTCKTCVYSCKPTLGFYCRRFPKQEPVSPNYWCGEWKPISDTGPKQDVEVKSTGKKRGRKKKASVSVEASDNETKQEGKE